MAESGLHERVKSLETRMTKSEVELSKKVDWKWFFGMLISLITIQLTVSSLMWDEIKSVRATSDDTHTIVTSINGKLQPFDFLIDDK